jgi:hypothetical protein
MKRAQNVSFSRTTKIVAVGMSGVIIRLKMELPYTKGAIENTERAPSAMAA